jgi:uncharacterized protein (DUF1330 family)
MYLARGGPNETPEVDWCFQRLVILEFESVERVKAWLNSPEFTPARTLYHTYTKSKMVVESSI